MTRPPSAEYGHVLDIFGDTKEESSEYAPHKFTARGRQSLLQNNRDDPTKGMVKLAPPPLTLHCRPSPVLPATFSCCTTDTEFACSFLPLPHRGLFPPTPYLKPSPPALSLLLLSLPPPARLKFQENVSLHEPRNRCRAVANSSIWTDSISMVGCLTERSVLWGFVQLYTAAKRIALLYARPLPPAPIVREKLQVMKYG